MDIDFVRYGAKYSGACKLKLEKYSKIADFLKKGIDITCNCLLLVHRTTEPNGFAMGAATEAIDSLSKYQSCSATRYTMGHDFGQSVRHLSNSNTPRDLFLSACLLWRMTKAERNRPVAGVPFGILLANSIAETSNFTDSGY